MPPKKNAPKENPLGIPRTHNRAKKLGYKRVTVKFSTLSNEVRGSFVQLSEHGSRPGSLCGVAPSPDPSYWFVCYKNEKGRCTWVRVPRGERVETHG
jgi:hypothetical protein